jgi:hypothetical protein
MWVAGGRQNRKIRPTHRQTDVVVLSCFALTEVCVSLRAHDGFKNLLRLSHVFWLVTHGVSPVLRQAYILIAVVNFSAVK